VTEEKSRPNAVDEMDAAVAYKNIINFRKQCNWRLKEAFDGIQATKYHSFSPEFLLYFTISRFLEIPFDTLPWEKINSHKALN